MDDVTRRRALKMATLGIAASAVEPALDPGQAAATEDEARPANDAPKTDRDFVIAAGMTEGEADCWAAAADCAGKFFALPELHPMDNQEIAQAIHVIQNKLLSRPTYRAYLKNAKGG